MFDKVIIILIMGIMILALLIGLASKGREITILELNIENLESDKNKLMEENIELRYELFKITQDTVYLNSIYYKGEDSE